MTQQAFLMYANFLADELYAYRRSVPLGTEDHRFLLILDGHSSRLPFEAIRFLDEQGIDVLVLPAHCTHILQAFDVGLASPLKTRLIEFCEQTNFILNENNVLELSESLLSLRWLGEKRRLLFQAFLWAWDEIASMKNITSAFITVGMVPLNPQSPLANPATRQSKSDDSLPDPPFVYHGLWRSVHPEKVGTPMRKVLLWIPDQEGRYVLSCALPVLQRPPEPEHN
jgi:hypothetical protein